MATLEQVFQREKAWIAACEDVDVLIEKIGDWRDSLREAERDGDQLVRMRAGDLVALARQRVVWLQAREMRTERAPARPAPEPAAVPANVARADRPKPAPQATTPVHDAARRAQESADAKAKADARLVAAEAAKVELQNELLKVQIEAARRAPAAPAAPAAKEAKRYEPVRAAPAKSVAVTPGPTPKATKAASPPSPARAPTAASKPATAPRDEEYTEADRLALASVGHWPPTPPAHRGAFWTKDDDWPRDWTLTGGDLGRFRGEVNLTRAVFAAQLGVPSAVVKAAEMSPRERVGPALQIVLRRAMDHAAEERRRRREERAAAAARPEPAIAAEVAMVTPEAPPTGLASGSPAAASVAFTGADLARLRAERRLTQKEMADLLGVEQGTISKGEAKAGAALGPALQGAMARLGAAHGAEGALVPPE